MWEVFWACEIGLDTAFRIENAMGTYLSTHAIAFSIQSHRLKPNLTSLDSAAAPHTVFLNLVTVNRKYYRSSRCSLRGLSKNFPYFCKRSGAIFAVIFFGRQKPNLKTPRAALAALSMRVKLPFRRWLWGKTAMACVLKVRTHCSFFPETPYQR